MRETREGIGTWNQGPTSDQGAAPSELVSNTESIKSRGPRPTHFMSAISMAPGRHMLVEKRDAAGHYSLAAERPRPSGEITVA